MSPSRPPTLLAVALLVVACAAVYANTLSGALHLDDHYRIGNWEDGTGNPELERVWPPWRHFVDPSTSTTLPTLEQYRPLLPLSLSLSHWLSDATGTGRLAGLHLGNIAAHALSCVLLFLFFRELLARGGGSGGADPGAHNGPAALAALLFAVHPVSGVPVNYLCARDLLLMQTFLAAGLWAYARMRRRGEGALGWACVLVLLALALCSKQNALAAPGLILAFELVFAPAELRRLRGWLRVAPFALLSVGFYAFTEYGLDFSDLGQLKIDRPWFEYPLTQAREHVTHYLRNAVAPFWLRPLPHVEPAGAWDPAALFGLAFCLASLALAWRARRRAPVAAFCVLAYWMLMALTSSVIPLRSLATDYRQYPSLAFLCLFAVVAGRALVPRRAAAPAAALVALYLAGVGVFHHNPIWRESRTLWGRSVGVGAGGTFRAHQNYGQSIVTTDPAGAELHFRRALEMSPGDVYSHINLGLLLFDQGRPDEGFASAQRAATLTPGWAVTRYYLGDAHWRLGNTREAAAEFARAANLEPRNVQYLYWAGKSASVVEDFAGSEGFLARLHAIVPRYADSLFLEGWALQKLDRRADAIERYRRFLDERPAHTQTLFNLAFALMEGGEPAEAVPLFQRALASDPGKVEVHHWLAQCYDALGQPARAEEHRRAYADARATDG